MKKQRNKEPKLTLKKAFIGVLLAKVLNITAILFAIGVISHNWAIIGRSLIGYLAALGVLVRCFDLNWKVELKRAVTIMGGIVAIMGILQLIYGIRNILCAGG